jgi:hypothetical protein
MSTEQPGKPQTYEEIDAAAVEALIGLQLSLHASNED